MIYLTEYCDRRSTDSRRSEERHKSNPHTTRLFVQCAAYAETDQASEVLSVAEAKGRLGDQVEHALGWFRSLGRGERYDGLLRTDVPMLPEDVIREAVVNPVIHRNYAATCAAVMFEVFSDRIDETSPGTLPNHMTVDEARLGGTMATAMVVLGLMEQRGRGWLLLRSRMCEFNGTEPDLIDSVNGDYVRVTFHLHATSVGADSA